MQNFILDWEHIGISGCIRNGLADWLSRLHQTPAEVEPAVAVADLCSIYTEVAIIEQVHGGNNLNKFSWSSDSILTACRACF